MTDDDIFDDLFHGCAIAAFIDQAIEERGPPDMEATRRRAYQLYEEAMADFGLRFASVGVPTVIAPSRSLYLIASQSL